MCKYRDSGQERDADRRGEGGERSERIARRSKIEREEERGEREKEDRGWPFCARRAKDAFESLIPFETLILGAKWRERTVFFG